MLDCMLLRDCIILPYSKYWDTFVGLKKKNIFFVAIFSKGRDLSVYYPGTQIYFQTGACLFTLMKFSVFYLYVFEGELQTGLAGIIGQKKG